ncbi:MAG: NADH:ubiquinone reductase (Na(+)-transporting) subunit A [Simkania sp.]|nr:NADH:ubiquinone reductase (Na(+)-transporting) subunit A [Simkania sp.]MCP5490685.1 NADH:ubiquinone reductase (Na(+)-transporting) subunit A [Chlamydiales bacterium]
MHIRIKRGLDIPLKGNPQGSMQRLSAPTLAFLDLDDFYFLRFSLLKKPGDKVLIGEPLLEDKSCPGRVFVSPAAGTLKEVVRGLKRRILSVKISCQVDKEFFDHGHCQTDSKEKLLSHLMKGGLFPHIVVRPCNRLPSPQTIPEAIFVSALSSAPYAPPPELEVQGHETHFQKGLSALATLCPVHLIMHKNTTTDPFLKASDVEKHTAEGPHPIGNPSLHIAAIHPITRSDQIVWTLTVPNVIAVGRLVSEGKYEQEQVISIAGEGIPESKRGYFKISRGTPVQDLIRGRCDEDSARILSGNPLMGSKVSCHTSLKFFDNTFCVLPEPEEKRRFCHFLRLNAKSYTSTSAYFRRKKTAPFTTLQHGEERAFVDSAIYDRVMPLRIPVMHLVKAILAEDFELAESLGLLSVSPEDFALPAFICPSKIEMPEIIHRGLRSYADQYLES